MKNKLIQDCISGKWHLIAYGLGVSEGSKNCLLCQEYLENDCIGCPVVENNKDNYKCDGTPCKEIIAYTLLDNSMPDMIDAVEQQIIFLCSLLPEDHEWHEHRIDEDEENRLVYHMIRELSSLKYYYKSTIQGCFEAAIKNKGFRVSLDRKSVVVDKVEESLKFLCGC